MGERPGQDPAAARRRRAIWWWSLVIVSLLAVTVAAVAVRLGGGLRRSAQLKVDHVHALALVPGADILYVGAHDGLYVGADLGRHWQQVSGLAALVPAGADIDAMQVLADGRRPGHVYVAGHDLGVVLTPDGGATWQPAMAGLPLPRDAQPAAGRHPDVHALAADPQQPDLLYAWVEGFGLYHSRDGGAHWEPRAAQIAGIDVLALAVAPGDGNRIYAGGQGGFAVSADAGRTWRLSLSAFNAQLITGLWADPASPGALLATTDEDGLWRSADGGNNWERVRVRSLPAGLAAITGNPQHPTLLYLISQEGQLFISHDGGKGWAVL